MKKSVFIALFLLSLASSVGASPITVGAGQTVAVTFGTMPANWDPTDPPDYLTFTLGNLDWLGHHQTATWALYDGDRLISSYTGGGQGFSVLGAGQELPRGWTPAWETPFIDFTSLLDGTFDGRFEVSPVHGAFRFDPATLATCTYCPNPTGPHPVLLWDVVPPGQWAVAQADYDWIRYGSVDVTPRGGPADVLAPVPEPGTMSLVATGLGIGWLRARKRRQRRQEDAPAR